MKTARSEASHTMTVAPIQVPIPLMLRPSERRSVMTSATNVPISATPPSAFDDDCVSPQRAREERGHQGDRDREDDHRDDERRHVDVEPVEQERCDDQADGVRRAA